MLDSGTGGASSAASTALRTISFAPASSAAGASSRPRPLRNAANRRSRALLRQRPGGRLVLHSVGDGVPVVLAEKDHRQPEDPGEVHRRVEIPRGGPPVPEGGKHGDPLSADL